MIMNTAEGLCGLVYLSSCDPSITDDGLETLLCQARSDNEANEITGILIYDDGNFIQYFEGPESKVHELFDKIKDDPRHTSVTRLDFAKIDTRVFGDWWMGFRRLSDEDVGRIKGEHDQRTLMMDALNIDNENHITVIFKHCLQHMIRN